jgi:membrane dipeptidase
MRFFDAHCDSVLPSLAGKADFITGKGNAHIDLPRLLGAGVCVQLFAVFTAARRHPGRNERAFAEQAIKTIQGWAEASEGRMRLALTAADLRRACDDAGFHGLLGLEGCDCLGDNADNLVRFVASGVRHIIPAWDDNAFSGTVMGAGGPLTGEGALLVQLAEQLRVMVDVSHLSDTAFGQVVEITRQPFVASHSNCRALSPSVRNLTDEMIRILAGRGGVMGINLAPDFLAPEYLAAWQAIVVPAQATADAIDDPIEKARLRAAYMAEIERTPLPGIEWIGRHMRHAIDIGGEDCVGLGGDLDGIHSLPAPMSGVESYTLIPDVLKAAGLTERQVDKVCWGNMLRVYTDVLA